MEDKSANVDVRPARRGDMAAVAGMIQELADFEKMPNGPKISKKELERDGFDAAPPRFHCLVASSSSVQQDEQDELLGFALYFPTYSTWGGPALALEDLYVRPAARRRGVGGRLFDAVAKEAHSAGCCRVDFHVLSWNPARSFYARRGAADLSAAEAWRCWRLAGAALAARAAAAAAAGTH